MMGMKQMIYMGEQTRITYKDVSEQMKEDSKKGNEKRNTELHLSGIAVCGMKYGYEVENQINIPFRQSMLMGLAFENELYYKVRKLDKTYLHNYPIKLNVWNFNPKYAQAIQGNPDYISLYKNHIIEVKTSHGETYKDIYARQLKAYMMAYEIVFGKKAYGSLWDYDKNTDTVIETEFTPNDITQTDRELISDSFDAYFNKEYSELLPNSLCKFCKNKDCPGNPKYLEVVE